MPTQFQVQTACKINLSLLVFKPNRKGYHPICSIFQAVNWWDTLHITLTPSEKILKISCPKHPDLEKNNLIKELILEENILKEICII